MTVLHELAESLELGDSCCWRNLLILPSQSKAEAEGTGPVLSNSTALGTDA